MNIATLIQRGGLTRLTASVAARRSKENGNVAEIATIAVAKPPFSGIQRESSTGVSANLESAITDAAIAIPAIVATDRPYYDNNPEVCGDEKAFGIAATWRRMFGFNRPVAEIRNQLDQIERWQAQRNEWRNGE